MTILGFAYTVSKGKQMELAPANDRGFQKGKFKDRYGADCSIQESSLATEACIWLGCDHETIHGKTGERCGARMHLTQAMVSELIPLLQHFVDTGELPVNNKLLKRRHRMKTFEAATQAMIDADRDNGHIGVDDPEWGRYESMLRAALLIVGKHLYCEPAIAAVLKGEA
jgi:hypothetical protein